MRLSKLRFSISTILVMVTICVFVVHERVSSYRQQVLPAQKIEELGGEVLYGWQAPFVEDDFWLASFARPNSSGAGAPRMRPVVKSIPYRRVETLPTNTPRTWSVFDYSTDWNIRYVAFPDHCFVEEHTELLQSLPKLSYIEVRWSGESYFQATAADEERLKKLRELFPNVEVIFMYEHLLNRLNK